MMISNFENANLKIMSLKNLLLCPRYDARVEMKNRSLGAPLEMFTTSCSMCAEKLMITRGSKNLLDSNREVKPICEVCAAPIFEKANPTVISVTEEQKREIAAVFERFRARNN
jgi:NADH pyrophosphatase NudC (nudix superfamily)